MDPILIAVILIVVTPIAVIWALSASARLRGPLPRPESKRPVETLVTDAIPEEHPDDEEQDQPGPSYSIDSRG